MILPLDEFYGNSDGENYIWSLFKKVLPDSYVSFHNYYIGYRQVDIILLVPRLGVLIIENKSYRAKNIIDVPDANTIRRIGNPPDRSPFAQAISYRNLFINNYLNPENLKSIYAVTAVSYPYISEKEFFEKKLDKICKRDLVFVAEDFASQDSLLKRIEAVFNFCYDNLHSPDLVPYGFTNDLLERVGNLISNDFRNTNGKEPGEVDELNILLKKTQQEQKMSLYSHLIASDNGTAFSKQGIEDLVNQWMSGTKLQLYTHDKAAYERLASAFSDAVRNLDAGIEYADGKSFRLEISLTNSSCPNIDIVNGEGIESIQRELTVLNNCSSFNLGQYQMEHAPETDVIVKAGAGTGKTFSLISRINYLIWKNGVDPENLKTFLAMITFTNDSADSMQEDLAKNFLNFYRLTSKTTGAKYLHFLEAAQNIRISTIDSLAKALLSGFSSKIGLGINFNITTGIYRRREILRDTLNEYLQEHPEAAASIPMPMYYFEKRLQELLDKFGNKSVDISKDDSIVFGSGSMALPSGIIDVLRETQRKISEDTISNNSLCLGNLISELHYLVKELTTEDIPEEYRIKYLFVDEFQDTDDIQIDLIKSFQKLLGFHYFVVGDTKQCIYRFRGAEDMAFEHLTAGSDNENVYRVSLQKNYRTDTTLMNQMNEIFSAWDEAGDLSYADDDILIGTKEYNDKEPLHMMPAHPDGSIDENKLVDLIRCSLEEVKPYNGSVAILVRYNYEVKSIIDICRRRNISLTTEVGGDLFAIDPTIDLQKLLLALRYNQEPEYIFNLYTTCFAKEAMPKAQMLGMTREEMVRFFENNGPLQNWHQYLEDLKTQPVLRVLQQIVKDTQPWLVFAKKIGGTDEDKKRNSRYYMCNLDQLFENLVRISNTDYLTINKLTDYLDTMIVTRQQENAREVFGVTSDASGLICTTVHKAKGLQYDTVILPFCSFDISALRSKGTVDVIFENNEVGYLIKDDKRKKTFVNEIYEKYRGDESISRRKEETRILYVAMTRTKRSLYCFVPEAPKTRSLTWAKRLKGE